MAESDKDDERKSQTSPADGLREAVERTFRDAAGNMAGAGSRAQGFLDEAAAALSRLGSAGDSELAAAVDRLTARVEALAARVDRLEGGAPAKPKPASKAATKPASAAKLKAKPKPAGKAKAKPASAAKPKAKAKPAPKVKAGLDPRAVAQRDGGGPKNPVTKPADPA